MSGQPKNNNTVLKTVGLVSAIGVDLAITLMAGLYGGRWLDRWLGTSPWFFIIGTLIGLGAGIYGVYLLLKPFIGDQQQ